MEGSYWKRIERFGWKRKETDGKQIVTTERTEIQFIIVTEADPSLILPS